MTEKIKSLGLDHARLVRLAQAEIDAGSLMLYF